jgi:hypothetical protein
MEDKGQNIDETKAKYTCKSSDYAKCNVYKSKR